MLRFFVLLLCILPFRAYGAGVAINEILFNPVGSDPGFESIEIYNPDDAGYDLSGWQLYPDGVGYFYFPEHFNLGAKKIAVIHLKSSGINTSADLYFPGASGGMGNTSGSVALFSGEPRGKDTIKSFAQWGRAGETWEGDAEKAGLWTKGEFINSADLAENGSIGFISDGTGSGKNAWKLFTANTIGFLNSNSAPEAAASPITTDNLQATVSAGSQQNYAIPLSARQLPRIKVYAGEDKNIVVGSAAEFVGNAFGLENESITNARFWWNFGDGETDEGKSVSHVFRIPGRYTVGLHVSSGEYAASDYLIVEASSNQMRVKSVLEGEEGYATLINPSSLDIDIGGWILEDGSVGKFYLPVKTIIAGKSEISLANRLTGLFLQKEAYPVVLRYANADPVYTLKMKDGTITQNKLIAASSSMSEKITHGSPPGAGETQDTADSSNIGGREGPDDIASTTGLYQDNSLATAAGSPASGIFSGRKLFIIAAVILGLISATAFFILRKAYNV